MTGTLAPIKWLLNDYADEVHLADYFEKCEHVVPKEVCLINGKSAKKILVNSIRAGRRIVYFANTIKSMTQLYRLSQRQRHIRARYRRYVCRRQ